MISRETFVVIISILRTETWKPENVWYFLAGTFPPPPAGPHENKGFARRSCS